VTSRVAEKERRRAERLERERELGECERRRRRLWVAAAAATTVLAAGAIVALASVVGGRSTDLPAGSGGAFGPHYAGIAQRRETAGVSRMSTPTADVHIHPKLSLWANGKRISVPANIGIDPRDDPSQMAGLHTHDSSGVIHDEGMGDATLGQFFAIWGVAFGRDTLGPYRASAGKTVQLWVDGKPSPAYGSLKLADGQDIKVTYGPPRNAPPAS
jgi:hypothetical protein